mmetsp:Transcript_13104/g.19637  ORF Transcript_13104/g.19637 Transcript_13104/m.19637 type:complete len:142 (-) Transcript_13104:447-872(-)
MTRMRMSLFFQIFSLFALIQIMKCLHKDPDASKRDDNSQERDTNQESKKVAMVPVSYAIPYPWTMMIKFGNADVTTVAMFGAWWTEDVAGGAISESQGAANLHYFCFIFHFSFRTTTFTDTAPAPATGTAIAINAAVWFMT